MNLRLTRRRFGQLVIAGTAAAGMTYLANKTFAQTPQVLVVGIGSSNPINIDDTTPTVSDSTEISNTESFTATSTDLGLVLPTLNVATGLVQTPSPVQGVTIQSGEELSAFTSLANGTLVVAITPASTSNKGGDPTRLVFLSTPSRTVTLSGLKKQEKLQSLVGTSQGGLLGLVVRKNGQPPVTLVNIDIQNGAITSSSNINLPGNERFRNLAQCPDGKLYSTVIGRRGETSLVEMDLGQQKPVPLAQLKLGDTVWNNGLQSLVCSPGGELFAFGALRYETPNYLHTVDKSNGAMTRLTSFDVALATILLTTAPV